MSNVLPRDYFVDLKQFPNNDVSFVWEIIGSLNENLISLVQSAVLPEGDKVDIQGLQVNGYGIVSTDTFVSANSFKISSLNILIEEGVEIEPGVFIKGPCKLSEGCKIRHGAYLRESCLIGEKSVVGHVTEVKNSIFLKGSEAGHFAYVGDSILGALSNLGAGTKLANLEFRTQEEKEKRFAKTIKIPFDGKEFDTGLRKLGAIIGDGVEVGCNVVTSPGTLIGRGCWITPNTSVKKGIYGERKIIRSRYNKAVESDIRF
tara:strand:+ start:770 stop:1549 length:780 start_codon:yes stop_codon:yes gene_type:complete